MPKRHTHTHTHTHTPRWPGPGGQSLGDKLFDLRLREGRQATRGSPQPAAFLSCRHVVRVRPTSFFVTPGSRGRAWAGRRPGTCAR